jgi:hypothetical protein
VPHDEPGDHKNTPISAHVFGMIMFTEKNELYHEQELFVPFSKHP